MSKRDRLFKLRVVLLILLGVSIFVSADFLQTYQYSMFTYDGSIACSSVLHKFFLIFEDGSWSVRRFYNAFVNALWFTVFMALANIGLAIYDLVLRHREEKNGGQE